jgi:hypothetical protein
MTTVDFKYDLGVEVKCKITGFKGVIVARSQWLNNCNTYGVKSRELKDGKPMENQFFDEPSLELVAPEAEPIPAKRTTGGPCESIPQTNR